MTLDAIYQRFVNAVVGILDPQRLREALDRRLAADVVEQLASPSLESHMRQIERYLATAGDGFDGEDFDLSDVDLDAELLEADAADADGLTLEADCAIYALLEEKNWQEWREDERRGIHQTPRPKTVYDLYDAYLNGQASRSQGRQNEPVGSPAPALAHRESSDGALGMYKFTEDGECVTVLGGKWHAVAYELDAMFRRAEPCDWDR